MEARSLPLAKTRRLDIDLAGAATWTVTTVLIVYLALKNGGYDVVERSEIGIAVWWIVLLGTAVGAIAVRPSRATALLFGALLAFAAWTALSLTWTESAERTMIETSRAITYLGVFAIAIAIAAGAQWRALLGGVITAVSLVPVLAVLSRMEPNLFPDQIAADYIPGVQLGRRLAYPLNYSTGLAAVSAMAIPLLFSVTAAARWTLLKPLAAALVPISVLAIWLTASSLAIPLTTIAAVAFLAFTNDRPLALATMLNVAGGSALLIAAIEQRDALDQGVVTAAALDQGDSMLAVILITCAGVALVQAGITIIDRIVERPAWMRGSSRRTAWVVGGLAVLTIGASTVTPLRGEIEEGWDKFTAPSELDRRESTRFEQIVDLSSHGRYQFWVSAVNAGEAHPLEGIGAGTFEFWWARDRTELGFARDAHSLFLEAFAELGVIGFVLILGFALGIVGVGWSRVTRAGPAARPLLAGALAAFIVFLAAAATDWMWELAVLPVAALVLAAVVLAGGDGASALQRPRRWGPGLRLAIGATAVLAIAVIIGPLASTTAVEASRSAAASADLDRALDRSADAEAIQPYAATPALQRALILEQSGDLDGATAAAREAVDREPTNWSNWLVLARIEARAGEVEAALRDYRHAKSLNPHSDVFDQAPE